MKTQNLIFGKLLFLASFFLVSALLPASASALSGSDFQAGRIIDNSVFYNSSSMTIQQIQDFLNSKVPVCDTNGTQPIYGTTRASYSASQGHPAPFICLKDYSQTVPAITNSGSDLCTGSITAGTKSSAQIIYDASRACGINPQVLIVLLQKEQSLVTDDWPWDTQYRSATGYGCPDTAPCDSEYYGFFNQVYQAAKAFRRYEANPNSYNYKANRNNTIYYNPNLSGCGSSNVFIENQATASLYIYTPYQPNTAALNNLYGTGDSCSAYGNRNFWRLFNDWFGSTQNANYSWSLVSQTVHTDQTRTVPVGTSNMAPNNRVYATISIRNTGNQSWSNTGSNPIRFGTVRPHERQSVFCDPTWLSCSRPATMAEATVAPEGIATFSFWLKAPLNGAQVSEYFAPVIEGSLWMQDIGLFYSMQTNPAVFSWQMLSQYSYTDQTKTSVRSLNNLLPGEKAYIGFTARNTGNMTWGNTGPQSILVGTLSPNERPSVFSPGSSWLSGTRPALLQESSVAPGQTGTFEFWMTAPNAPGERHERFGLIANGYSWFNDTGLSFYTNILPQTYTWQMTSQYAYTDQTKTTVKNLGNLVPGERTYVGFKAKNTGTITWRNTGTNALLVGTTSPNERPSVFSPSSGWLSGTRPALLQESTVAPGQTGTFEFWMTAPNAPGERHERFNIIANNLTWFNDLGLSFYTKVN